MVSTSAPNPDKGVDPLRTVAPQLRGGGGQETGGDELLLAFPASTSHT